jgi:hypothetical protein
MILENHTFRKLMEIFLVAWVREGDWGGENPGNEVPVREGQGHAIVIKYFLFPCLIRSFSNFSSIFLKDLSSRSLF